MSIPNASNAGSYPSYFDATALEPLSLGVSGDLRVEIIFPRFFAPLVTGVLFLSAYLLLLSGRGHTRFVPYIRTSTFLVFRNFYVGRTVTTNRKARSSIEVGALKGVGFSVFRVYPSGTTTLSSFFGIVDRGTVCFFRAS